MEKGFREVPHIADVALEVWGKDLPELFVHAAQGLSSLAVTVETGAAISAERQVHLTAPDWETLLVDWLNELLLLQAEHDEAYITFDVVLPAVGELSARVGGTRDFTVQRTIKAATFHDLVIQETPEGYRAVVVLDV